MVVQKGVIFAEKYEVLDTLSSGAQASVYTALQKPLDRIVILKVLSPALVANPEIVARFEREAKLLSALKDESVTKIYDYGKTDGVYFFVSEYVEGQSVKELLEKKGRLPLQLVAYIILESAKALVRLHEQNIIHRDIKPGNILLSQDGKVKLTDFGLASSLAMPSLTIEGSILGTPAYMSPEQILGKAVDNRSDIYSLGVVFYELITGKNPFVASTYSAIMHNVLNLKPTPFYKSEPLLEQTRDLWQIVERMIKKNSGERIDNIDEVADKLRQWFNKDENKTWQFVTINPKPEILNPKQYQNSNIQTSGQRKTVSGVRIAVKIFILLVVLFGLIIVVPILQIKNGKANKKTGFISSAESLTLESSAMPLNDSDKMVKPDSPKLKSVAVKEPTDASPDMQTTIKSNARIKIQVLPWATVFIDGKEIFTTPKDTILDLPTGAYNFRFVNPGFPIAESVIAIKSDSLNIRIDLTERVGYLAILVTPWADIFIDDEFEQTTPLSQPIMVKPGKRKLTVKNPYYAPYQEIIDFEAKKTVERNIVLQ